MVKNFCGRFIPYNQMSTEGCLYLSEILQKGYRRTHQRRMDMKAKFGDDINNLNRVRGGGGISVVITI